MGGSNDETTIRPSVGCKPSRGADRRTPTGGTTGLDGRTGAPALAGDGGRLFARVVRRRVGRAGRLLCRRNLAAAPAGQDRPPRSAGRRTDGRRDAGICKATAPAYSHVVRAGDGRTATAPDTTDALPARDCR